MWTWIVSTSKYPGLLSNEPYWAEYGLLGNFEFVLRDNHVVTVENRKICS